MPITREQITGLLLAGGRGTRMGGADKGLQTLHGKPLAAHVLERLAPQTGTLLISANRNAQAYAALGAPFGATVVADSLPDFPGPLAGLLAGLRAAAGAGVGSGMGSAGQKATPYLLSAPCDSPWLPADLAARLADALESHQADIATATTVAADGSTKLHPVFALLRVTLADDLSAFLAAGERKVRAWYARHKTVEVSFTDERAFYNANSLEELADLERDRGPA